jgi:hypothetical protein
MFPPAPSAASAAADSSSDDDSDLYPVNLAVGAGPLSGPPHNLKTSVARLLATRRGRGFRLQRSVAAAVADACDLPRQDVVSTPRGVNGADLHLSAAASMRFPFKLEIKLRAPPRSDIWASLRQASRHPGYGCPAVVIARTPTASGAFIVFEADFVPARLTGMVAPDQDAPFVWAHRGSLWDRCDRAYPGAATLQAYGGAAAGARAVAFPLSVFLAHV